MSDDERGPAGREGFEAATERSEGNPWVVHGLNAVLSAMFASTVVWGLDFLGTDVAFTPINVATGTIVVFSAAYLMSVR